MLLLLKKFFFSFVQFTIENVNVMIIINLILPIHIRGWRLVQGADR